MATYKCEKCSKVFEQKSHYDTHLARVRPCKKNKAVEELEKQIESLKNPEPQPEEEGSFRAVSKKFNTELDKDTRQAQGIFFTPREAREKIFQTLDTLDVHPSVVLEPSFGSGEFIYDVRKKYPEAKIFGVEMNPDLFQSVKIGTLFNMDFLNFKGCPAADLIVGNPPYFVMEKKGKAKKERLAFDELWKDCMVERQNIYVAFLYKCLTQHLKPGGILAFVIPTSLMNCSYYQPMRNYIAAHTTIHRVEELRVKYFDTAQDTMYIVLQNTPGSGAYRYTLAGNIYISPYWKELQDLVKNVKTLDALGFASTTGSVVWNQVKDKMADEGMLVIYNTNIRNGKLVLGNITAKEGKASEKKRQYIKDFKKEPLEGPLFLVNRGHGNASYTFNYVFVPQSQGKFYAENHVNVIYPTTEAAKKHIPLIQKSFEDDRTKKFLEYFVGNGSLNSTELQHILPIFT
jgi:adenine-specific DNA-methyltransferase